MHNIVARWVDVAWRRRFFFLLPIVLMLPMSVFAALSLPGKYVARTLVQVQEAPTSNPILGGGAQRTAEKLPERIDGLRALLYSDYVLERVASDLRITGDEKERSNFIRDMRGTLQIEAAGIDYFEVRLTSGVGKGLGATLDTVMRRFFEAVLAHNAPSAAEFLLRAEQQDLRAAEESYARLREQLSISFPDAADRLRQQLIESEKVLAAARQNYEANTKRLERLTSGNVAQAPRPSERILVIDPPRDPLTSSVPRSLFVFFGLITGVILGVSFVVAAELLDGTLRYSSDLETLLDTPLLVTMPVKPNVATQLEVSDLADAKSFFRDLESIRRQAAE